MKKIILLVMSIFSVSIIFTNILTAQKLKNSKVPQIVLQAFQKQFPTIKKVKWEKENAGTYEAEFKELGVEKSAIFDEQGNFVEVEKEISMNDLPKNVMNLIHSKYPNYKIEEPEMIQRANGSIVYELEVEKGKKSLELLVSDNGEIIKETQEED